jgi:hypothetical protein
MENINQYKNEFLYEKYLEFYDNVELHHTMNINEFLNDDYIYRQIVLIYEKDYKKWYNRKFRKEKIKICLG